jgi:hypothetical protein
MIDLSHINEVLYTTLATLVGVAGTTARFCYKKYTDLVQKVESRPTIEQTKEIVDTEIEKMSVHIAYIGKRLDEMHDDISDIREYILNATRKTAKDKDPNSGMH